MKKGIILLGFLTSMVSCTSNKGSHEENLTQFSSSDLVDYPIRPVPFTAVQVTDNFWAPRIQTNKEVTLPYTFKKSEETGRLKNFAIAGGLEEGEFEGIFFNDSDVFKII